MIKTFTKIVYISAERNISWISISENEKILYLVHSELKNQRNLTILTLASRIDNK